MLFRSKINRSTGPVAVLLPWGGLSMIDSPGGPFWWPEADRALFESLKSHLRSDIPVIEMQCNINDAAFARRCAEVLLELIERNASCPSRAVKS